jgi:hypothetical protein
MLRFFLTGETKAPQPPKGGVFKILLMQKKARLVNQPGFFLTGNFHTKSLQITVYQQIIF